MVASIATMAGFVWLFISKRRTGVLAKSGSKAFQIVQCQTKTVVSQGCVKPVIYLGADLHDASAQEELVNALLERFLLQRMISPPDTSLLLITIIGPCDGKAFADRWRQLVVAHQGASVFMSQMEKADLSVATASGPVSPSFESLLLQ
jgi:hypothetical protein